MNISELVKMLISEGMSEKTLVNFSDKQLSDLHERMVIDADKLKDPKLQAIANDPNIEVEVKEDLKGNQKKLDKNHNGKIDGQDFKILKGQKKKKSVKTDTKDKEVKEWVESLAENNYHSFTSKNEIMEMIQLKLQEAGPNVNIGHNDVPEFMTYESSSDGDVETKPSKPKVTPGTKPKPHNPNQPGPFTKPKPKAEKK
jgi:protein required for attachment to host cells